MKSNYKSDPIIKKKLSRELKRHRSKLANLGFKSTEPLTKEVAEHFKMKRIGVKKARGPYTPKEHRKIFKRFAKKFAKGFKRKKVVSSNLHSVGYDKEHKVLEVAFRKKDTKHPSIYRYSGVSPRIYDRLLNADSHGKFFNKKIKSKYIFVKVK